VTPRGNLTGLAPAEKRALERLGSRRLPASRIITPEIAQTMALLSREIGRQIGLFIDRNGQITDVAVGDASRIELPDFGRLRAGEHRFRGLRFVHTHLRAEPLSRDDLTDLTRLRLDMIAAVGVTSEGSPGAVYLAHLLPPGGDSPYRLLGPLNLGMLPADFLGLVTALEEEFGRVAGAREVRAPEGRAVLVHVTTDRRRTAEAERALDELAELARTAGVAIADRVVQVRDKPDPRFVMGKGKLEDITVRAMHLDAELLILDCNLGANQARAIAEVTELKVIDRTQLILDIFAQRAHSRDGKLKVELAQLKYLLPRLGARDDSLSRLTGGIGGRRGPGETVMEIGRRRAREKIARIEKKLDGLGKGRSQRRALRRRSAIPIVSIVGYTNAGKSMLLNALTNSDVLVEDKLFATLDTASRRLRFPREREVIVTDTVGFIRDLPRDLLDAFKATLEEMRDASLLLHIVDAADPARAEHVRCVEQLLVDLELHETPRLLVMNKADRVDPAAIRSEVESLGAVLVSALDRSTLAPLLERVEERLWARGAGEGR
jgi:GTP-binding protein HflX